MIFLFLMILASGASAETGRAERRAAYKQWDAGVALVLAGENARAKTAWEKCLALDPGNADCRAGLTLLAGEPAAEPVGEPSPEPAAAPEPVETSPALQETRIEPARRAVKHWNAGIIYFQKGDYRRALAEWRLCVQEDKMNEDCRTGIARVEGRLALPQKPAPAPKAVPKDPKEARQQEAFRHWNAGIVHFQKGEFEKARKEWMKCRKNDPTNMDCHTGLLRIQRQYGGS